jgi:tetratricopeptide (TPR) repeat protein
MGRLYPLLLTTLVILLIGGLSCINQKKIITTVPGDASGENKALQAEAIFNESPRKYERIQTAFEMMFEVAQSTAVHNPRRFEYLIQASRFANWLAYYGEKGSDKGRFAEQAMVLCNTAIQADPERVEGYYYRSIATGLFAQENRLFGRDAMVKMRQDALRAIEINPNFDSGGPSRVLGALYLRAPGPPTGIGSPRRALQYFKESLSIVSDHPETQLFMAEAYLKLKDKVSASKILEEFRTDTDYWDETEKNHWNQRYHELQNNLDRDNLN